MTETGRGTAREARRDLATIDAAVRALGRAVTDAGRWPDLDRRDLLRGLDRAVDALAAVRVAVLVAERESGAWQRSGDRSFEAWRGRTARTGLRSAAAEVRQAEHLAAAPAVTAAVAEGRISLEHAAIIARTAGDGTPAQRSAAASRAGQQHLLGLAERLDAGTFATAVARWASAVDPDALEQDHRAQRAARYLHVTGTPRGTFVKGRLDSMAGHRLTLALEALSPRPGADDDRDPGQRRADALDAMARRILASGDTKPGSHVPPQVSFLLSAETWIAARADRDRRRAVRARESQPGAAPGRRGPRHDAGDPGSESAPAQASEPARTPAAKPAPASASAAGSTDRPGASHATAPIGAPSSPATDDGGSAPVLGYPPATLEDGTPVPTSELAAALCDCEITRIVIDADGVPLDLGRAERAFTGQQRRAVIARDRECAWPECHAPARWCEIHHIRWWERDTGPTSVANGVLLCSYHHHEVHRRDLSITRIGADRGQRRGLASNGPPARTDVPLARVTYRFRDRHGFTVGDPAEPARGPVGTGAPRAPATHPVDPDEGATAGPRDVTPAATDTSPDDVGLDRATDPVTEARVPARSARAAGGG